MTEERIIPFPAAARSNGEHAPAQRRRRDVHELERPSPNRRTPRRRRQNTPWLQRNALSLVAVSVLVALLGLGFGLVQMINRPDPGPALLSLGQADTSNPASTQNGSSASTGLGTQQATAAGVQVAGPPTVEPRRDIVASSRVIDANYTVAAGDTLGQIAARFNTTVDRIQALNNLADPRALRIGTKLVIPPPF